jgi:hypothetical protein
MLLGSPAFAFQLVNCPSTAFPALFPIQNTVSFSGPATHVQFPLPDDRLAPIQKGLATRPETKLFSALEVMVTKYPLTLNNWLACALAKADAHVEATADAEYTFPVPEKYCRFGICFRKSSNRSCAVNARVPGGQILQTFDDVAPS